MRARRPVAAIVAIVLIAAVFPVGAIGGMTTDTAVTDTADHRTNAPPGQQLATVIEVSNDEVKGDVEAAAFDSDFESATDTERAELLADRAATLRERADGLVADREAATEAYRAGEVSMTVYARQLAVLNDRSNSLIEAFDRLDERAEGVPEAELQAAGYDRSADEESRTQLARLTGGGATALFQQYTAERTGEFAIDTDDGISIEVETEDGERTREFEREQPGNGTLLVTQNEAIDAARGVLATEIDGQWTLRSAEADSDDGIYEFEFRFRGPEHVGEAEVSVDGETGQVFELDEEIEIRDTDDEASLQIDVLGGTVGPGETVTLRVTTDGEPAEGAIIEIDSEVVGTTDSNGEITVTLPNSDGVDIEAEYNGTDAELEFEFSEAAMEGVDTDRDDEDDIDVADEPLEITVFEGTAAPGETVTLHVTSAGVSIEGATVEIEDDVVGFTDSNGQIVVTLPDSDEVDIEAEFGDSEGELELEFDDVSEADENDDDEASE